MDEKFAGRRTRGIIRTSLYIDIQCALILCRILYSSAMTPLRSLRLSFLLSSLLIPTYVLHSICVNTPDNVRKSRQTGVVRLSACIDPSVPPSFISYV